jgi:hypothetical protein
VFAAELSDSVQENFFAFLFGYPFISQGGPPKSILSMQQRRQSSCCFFFTILCPIPQVLAQESKAGPLIVFLKHAAEVAKNGKAALAFLAKLTGIEESPVVIIASSTECEEDDDSVSASKQYFCLFIFV